MTRVACIVEGHGEVSALPLLLRRMAELSDPDAYIDVPQPIRVSRDRFINRPEEFSRHLLLAGSKSGNDGWILVLLDADDACPATLGSELLARAKEVLPNHSVSVVIANREFEAWYIGAAESLNGFRGFRLDEEDLAIDAEVPRDAKGWLGKRMDGGYGETTDQPAFAARMNLQQALDRCRSFRKLWKELDRYIALRKGCEGD
ncbi:MAG TPA: DUF4276 family protein [Xanthomonadaceae bacterium]